MFRLNEVLLPDPAIVFVDERPDRCRHPINGRVATSMANQTHCLLPLSSTNDHHSSFGPSVTLGLGDN